jgi:MFS family permease
MARWKPILLSAVSGCAWAWIAVSLLDRASSRPVWAGVLASPVIGALAGMLSRGFQRRRLPAQALLALSSLYCAAALFGAAGGLADVLFGVNAGPGWHRTPGAAMIESVLAMLWGLTFTGYVMVLWPLAWVNHVIVARFWSDEGPENLRPDGERTSGLQSPRSRSRNRFVLWRASAAFWHS